MYYIGNVVKSVAGIYNQINAATLTGAIDIVVIKQEDGSFIGSPFHVRFGKLGVLSSREKVVEIAINNVEVDLQMKLGVAGEAFFVERASMKESIPLNLATSPLPSSSNLLDFQFSHENVKDFITDDEETQNSDYLTMNVKATRTSSMPIIPNESPNNDIRKHQSDNIAIPGVDKTMLYGLNQDHEQHLSIPALATSKIRELQSNYPLSDMDSPISTPLSRSPEDPSPIRQIFSDTEAEVGVEKTSSVNQNITWEWGMLPKSPAIQKKSPRDNKSSTTERKRKAEKHRKAKRETLQEKVSSSEGLLLEDVLAADREVAQLYLNRANSIDDVDSGCGRESTPVTSSIGDNEEHTNATSSPTDEQNKDDTLPLSDLSEPGELDMSLCGDLKNRMVEPEKFLESRVTYEQFCENPELLNDPKLVIRIDNRYYNWAVAAPFLMSHLVYQKTLLPDSLKQLKQKYMPKKRRGWFSWRTAPEESSDEDKNDDKKGSHLTPQRQLSSADELELENGSISVHTVDQTDFTEFKKTLRLTSEHWRSLNLQHGANKVTFTVTTRYQGTASCDARIFLWNYSDKIVISDIDGTITRSDVLGQILPAVGKDWSQSNVTGLFSKIKKNGYNFMYLSARAIGQAQITRDFLKSVKQGETTLPDGPVLLTPTSLFNAFKKEVIERKPEEFKISCMRDVQSLFPKTSNPFFSGFGNRLNDVWAYRAVGIPISRIFTINYKGEIKHELTNAFTSSYGKLIDLVDQMFPPLTSSKTTDPSRSEYTLFCYWRTPVMAVPEDDVDEFEFP
ncbi:phosphatidate phosphatase LPIN3-like [Hydractinia symbiolongicarpus]|uniref:phosphatidate phosphatase LPIN3-like n=1 Tax=Hydractinia symbiolongicarpus TaxID=13093 RepID=UPI00254AF301|nr:phosphatidate phosphatase LPIN3-like [Hydractinia symbiolongicarpus]XP_057310330.1 phosphatidate phosphatase LPIN3-like [Hydractinia symbiolongicarpus]